ncbi:hypothetical protein [Marinilactibacillus psychrotolerans]|uniref:hypothetical protein n=1 Tax=Marinilactibacillus psychrotolerans TaxID=191770 RepID=UPI0038878109
MLDISKVLSGKIGISNHERIFIPHNGYILESVFKHILHHDTVKNEKGDILELYLKNILVSFFGKANVFHNLFPKISYGQGEQDFIVLHGEYTISIECKNHNFHSLDYYNDAISEITKLKRRFEDSVISGCKQAERVRKKIETQKAVFYFENDKKSQRRSKPAIDLNGRDLNKFIKIVVTMDDYVNTAEQFQQYVDNFDRKYSNTYVVNLFSLQKILWASQSVEEFIEYVQFRTRNKIIKSVESSELGHFGWYKNSLSSILDNTRDFGVTVNLKNSFTNLFAGYELESMEISIEKWIEDYKMSKGE